MLSSSRVRLKIALVKRRSIPLTDSERHTALALLAELCEYRLDVCLVPAPRPKHPCHMVRAKVSENPSWYRKLCDKHPSPRKKVRNRSKFDTDIRRLRVERCLQRLADTGVARYAYDMLLLPIVRQESPPF